MNERQTGENLKAIILNILEEYAIKLTQIYSITSDNGRNMRKAVELISDMAISLHTTDEYDEDDDEMNYSDDDSELENSTLINEVAELIKISFENSVSEKNLIVQSIKCGAHTLQLAVHDVLKSSTMKSNVVECRE